jgi:2-dehydropantoate 2-reductase
MKVAVAGAGAIGGLFAARLAKTGASEVSVLARGATLQALKAKGLRLLASGIESAFSTPVNASDSALALGVQDVVIVAIKATGLEALARSIEPLIGPQTIIVSAMNGLPWWFGVQRNPQPRWALDPLSSTDPEGRLREVMPPAQVIGCVTHLSASSPEPAVVQPGAGQRVLFGDPSHPGERSSERLLAIVALFAQAGFDVVSSPDIERELWIKLWGNMTMNPASAITGATGDLILDDPDVREFLSAIMREAAKVGEHIGLPIAMLPEERHAMTRKLGAFRTSMLQDADALKPLELDALLAAPIELGERVGVPMPFARALLGLARVRNLTLQRQAHQQVAAQQPG